MSLRALYDRQAARYAAERDRSLFELPWLERAVADVPAGGKVLDLGCGAGEPIGAWLAARGFAVTGVDFAPAMVALYRSAVPSARVVEADMRDLSLEEEFDAIIAWGSVFHLAADDQRVALPRIAEHLSPGGRLLLTVGPEAGETWGTVAGERVYHASLSSSEYAERLAKPGITIENFVAEDAACNGHSLLLARRP